MRIPQRRSVAVMVFFGWGGAGMAVIPPSLADDGVSLVTAPPPQSGYAVAYRPAEPGVAAWRAAGDAHVLLLDRQQCAFIDLALRCVGPTPLVVRFPDTAVGSRPRGVAGSADNSRKLWLGR